MEISDKENISKILNSVFTRNPVRYLSEDGKTPLCEFISYENFLIKIKTPKPDLKTSQRILICSQGKTFICKCEVSSKEDFYELLRPTRIVVKEEGDTQEKIQAVENREIQNAAVTNILSQNDVTKFLSDDKIREIIKSNSNRLSHLFSKYNIYLNERADDRLRLMHHYDQPIFIPNREDKLSVPDGFIPHYEYIRSVKPDKNDGMTAEICIPIKYRQFSTIGYVQVMNSSRLDLNAFNLVSLVAAAIKKEISLYSNYEESKEICKVYDITQTDISFFHSNNKHYSRIFYLGDIIIFDLVISKNRRITMRGVIRQIKALDSGFKIYCQYHNLTLQQLELIEGYLEESSVSD